MTAASKAPDFSAMARQIAAGERPVTLPQANASAAPGRTMGNVAPFGAPNGTQSERAKQEPAEFYINIGMNVPLPQDDGSTQDVFVTMGGVGLRTNADIGKATGLLAAAKTVMHANAWKLGHTMLEPGQAVVIGQAGPFLIEFRRVKDANAAPSATEQSVADAITATFDALFAAA